MPVSVEVKLASLVFAVAEHQLEFVLVLAAEGRLIAFFTLNTSVVLSLDGHWSYVSSIDRRVNVTSRHHLRAG